MGEQDHLFLPSIRKIVNAHVKSTLLVIESCGHVVNVDRPLVFNTNTIAFIKAV
jgi:pimeloyl-ACP methyl ester carboxylesterase